MKAVDDDRETDGNGYMEAAQRQKDRDRQRNTDMEGMEYMCVAVNVCCVCYTAACGAATKTAIRHSHAVLALIGAPIAGRPYFLCFFSISLKNHRFEQENVISPNRFSSNCVMGFAFNGVCVVSKLITYLQSQAI